MENVDDKYWQEAKKALDRITTNLQDTRVRKHDFWKHTTLIVVTTIGFSVALFSQSAQTPNFFTLLSLGLMLISVLFGLLLVREDIDINQHQEFSGSVSSYNNWIIMGRLQNGELSPQSEEHKGLIIANLIESFENIPHFDKKIFNKYAHDLAEKYKRQLPFQQFLKEIKGRKRWEDPVQKMVVKHFNRLVDLYYLIIFISLTLFFCGLLI